MNKQELNSNLQKVYDLSINMNKRIGEYFDALKEEGEKRNFIIKFLNQCNLGINEESILAALRKLIFLRDESLEQFMRKNNYSNEEIEEIKQKSYDWVKEFYEKEFQNLIEEIESKNLLTAFYLEILKGVHKVGLELNKLHPKWISKLNYVNSSLEEDFGNKEKIISFLKEKGLFDKGHKGEISERAYSMLIKEDDKYFVKTYPEIFPKEIKNILLELKNFREKIYEIDDGIYNQKQNYLDYLDFLISAISETDRHKLVLKWAEVDKAWIRITTPFQICHPFEEYDDPYRNTVSLEWDLRLPNPSLKQSKRIEEVENFYCNFFEKYGKEKYNSVYIQSLNKLRKIQLYLGKPILYYASELDGLPSAQVIPNNENVSDKYGKKIFAFPDDIFLAKQNSPFMLLPRKVYQEDFVKYLRNFIFNEENKWKKIYDLQTVGHECGHILWKDNKTNIKLNRTGNFEYIEEFKASATALAEFFYNEKLNLKKDIIYDTLTRAVSLISWREIPDRRAYYCEGLISLDILFESKIISFENNKLEINFNENTYKNFKEKFMKVYENLAQHYLNKKDASEFLFKYVEIIDKKYLPKKEYIRNFVEHYYNLYQKFGNQIDKEDSRENYIHFNN